MSGEIIQSACAALAGHDDERAKVTLTDATKGSGGPSAKPFLTCSCNASAGRI
jgi:hypothetical protein